MDPPRRNPSREADRDAQIRAAAKAMANDEFLLQIAPDLMDYPLAQLGLDPSRVTAMPEGLRRGDYEVKGQYWKNPVTGQMADMMRDWGRGDLATQGDALIMTQSGLEDPRTARHEGMHRGLEMLRGRYPEHEALPKGYWEEVLVRLLSEEPLGRPKNQYTKTTQQMTMLEELARALLEEQGRPVNRPPEYP